MTPKEIANNPKVETPEQLAEKFIQAGRGNVTIEPDDLKCIGVEFPTQSESWEEFCQYVYKDITGENIPNCTLKSISSRFHGIEVANAIREKFAAPHTNAIREKFAAPHTSKTYACSRCGHQTKQTTNHYGNTWSWGRMNVCPNCPPWAKYPEFGGQTIWNCLDKPCTTST